MAREEQERRVRRDLVLGELVPSSSTASMSSSSASPGLLRVARRAARGCSASHSPIAISAALMLRRRCTICRSMVAATACAHTRLRSRSSSGMPSSSQITVAGSGYARSRDHLHRAALERRREQLLDQPLDARRERTHRARREHLHDQLAQPGVRVTRLEQEPVPAMQREQAVRIEARRPGRIVGSRKPRGVRNARCAGRGRPARSA